MLAKYPEASIIWQNVGNAYFAQDKYDQAEEAYKKVLDKMPTSAEAITSIGNCYANRGQNDKALEWYNKVEFDKIKDVTVLYNIGTNYYNLSKFEDALKYYKRSVEVQKDYLDGLYQLGLTLTNLGRQGRGDLDLRGVHEARPGFAPVRPGQGIPGLLEEISGMKLRAWVWTAGLIVLGMTACAPPFELQLDPEGKAFFETARLVMTSEEEDIFRHLPDTESRREFMVDFWAKRNPDPASETNEFKEEFEKRID